MMEIHDFVYIHGLSYSNRRSESRAWAWALDCGGRRKRKTSNSYEIEAATMPVLKALRRARTAWQYSQMYISGKSEREMVLEVGEEGM